ncbi:hypothetical protein PIB30_038312 [Stylosanthes scabra]|uniref:Uncharacterized protein n=1 Tax=Stylosanthes scabra TaxID=79078 RepID=A0ABU6TDP0_9FABA|nr:hypothetical protein [Stylosanthes scabra]
MSYCHEYFCPSFRGVKISHVAGIHVGNTLSGTQRREIFPVGSDGGQNAPQGSGTKNEESTENWDGDENSSVTENGTVMRRDLESEDEKWTKTFTETGSESPPLSPLTPFPSSLSLTLRRTLYALSELLSHLTVGTAATPSPPEASVRSCRPVVHSSPHLASSPAAAASQSSRRPLLFVRGIRLTTASHPNLHCVLSSRRKVKSRLRTCLFVAPLFA